MPAVHHGSCIQHDKSNMAKNSCQDLKLANVIGLMKFGDLRHVSRLLVAPSWICDVYNYHDALQACFIEGTGDCDQQTVVGVSK